MPESRTWGIAVSEPVAILLENSRRARDNGRLDAASAELERAVRIENDNPAVWRRLAEVRMAQNRPREAEAMALKADRYADGLPGFRAGLWRLIARARQLQGNAGGATAASHKAAALAAQGAD
ncbi:MAG: tetratricopeptide repeat protein [Gammaproteobacteria bacterium]